MPRKDTQLFFILLGAMAAIFMLNTFLTAAKNMLQRTIRAKSGTDLQLFLLDHLHKLGFSYYENTPSGVTFSLLNTDVAATLRIYTELLPDCLYAASFIIVPLAILAVIDIRMVQ